MSVLHDFITLNRQALINRCRTKVGERHQPTGAPAAVDHGVPLFLQQLVETLRCEQATPGRHDTDPDSNLAHSDIGRAAALHGTELLRLGYSVEQVVHDYGDVCQSVTALAVEQNSVITVDEFRTLNRCLDNAIADAVASFGAAHLASVEQRSETLQQRMAFFAAEQRRLIDIAVKSVNAIKTGSVGIAGATGTLLTQTLEQLLALTDQTLPTILPPPPTRKQSSV